MHVPHIPTCVKVTQVLAFYPQNTRICRNSTHWVTLTRPHNHSYLHSRKHGRARLVHVSFLLVIFLNCWRILNYFFVFCIVCWLFCCLPCISLKLETLEFDHLLGLKGPPKKKRSSIPTICADDYVLDFDVDLYKKDGSDNPGFGNSIGFDLLFITLHHWFILFTWLQESQVRAGRRALRRWLGRRRFLVLRTKQTRESSNCEPSFYKE